jgi:hypothetical protein
MADKTVVVNVKKEPYDVFCGRPSIYGNPFRIGPDGTREEVIEKFKLYFFRRIHDDVTYAQAIGELRGKRIGCYCAPLPCHLDVIVEFLNRLE